MRPAVILTNEPKLVISMRVLNLIAVLHYITNSLQKSLRLYRCVDAQRLTERAISEILQFICFITECSCMQWWYNLRGVSDGSSLFLRNFAAMAKMKPDNHNNIMNIRPYQ